MSLSLFYTEVTEVTDSGNPRHCSMGIDYVKIPVQLSSVGTSTQREGPTLDQNICNNCLVNVFTVYVYTFEK